MARVAKKKRTIQKIDLEKANPKNFYSSFANDSHQAKSFSTLLPACPGSPTICKL
jgi:hypothetical protein